MEKAMELLHTKVAALNITIKNGEMFNENYRRQIESVKSIIMAINCFADKKIELRFDKGYAELIHIA